MPLSSGYKYISRDSGQDVISRRDPMVKSHLGIDFKLEGSATNMTSWISGYGMVLDCSVMTSIKVETRLS